MANNETSPSNFVFKETLSPEETNDSRRTAVGEYKKHNEDNGNKTFTADLLWKKIDDGIKETRGATAVLEGKRVEEVTLTEEAMYGAAMDRLRGAFGELLSIEVPLEKAATPFVSSDLDQRRFEGTHIVAVEQFFGTGRKDHILTLMRLQELGLRDNLIEAAKRADPVIISGKKDAVSVYELIDGKDAEIVIEKLSRVVKDFSSKLLPQRKVENEKLKREEKKGTDLETFLDEEISNLFRKGKDFEKGGQADEGFATAIVHMAKYCKEQALAASQHSKDPERGAEELYYKIVLPDFETANLQAVGETKSYTGEELAAWYATLKTNIQNEGEGYLAVNSLRSSVFIVGENRIVTLGFDPGKEKNFLRHQRKSQGLGNEEIADQGLILRVLDEPIPANVKKLYGEALGDLKEPINVDTLVKALGELMEESGGSNFVIQKIPFSSEDLGVMIQHYTKTYSETFRQKISEASDKQRNAVDRLDKNRELKLQAIQEEQDRYLKVIDRLAGKNELS